MKKECPLFSIITVTYNASDCLEKTIKSVLVQDFKDYEYIVIDGASSDGTLEIISNYKNYISTFISEKDYGVYDAMSKGVSLAKGKWINFLNAGDRFNEDTTLSKVSQYLPNDGVFYGNHRIENSAGEVGSVIDVSIRDGVRCIPFCHQAAFYNLETFKRYPFNLDFRLAGDFDQYMRLKFSKENFKYVPLTVAIYLDGGLSSTSRELLISEYYKIMKRYNYLYAKVVYLVRLIKLKLVKL